jgi:hypothetical protein
MSLIWLAIVSLLIYAQCSIRECRALLEDGEEGSALRLGHVFLGFDATLNLSSPRNTWSRKP